ncbi:DUF7848 domain-containing protein [Streptomyces sp. NHF165]|uniref:DUF7848 domain-containing protein n=1 Tax=Streptomyces sp. NHF165 TaxID=2175864 RepID=UPI003FCDB09D
MRHRKEPAYECLCRECDGESRLVPSPAAVRRWAVGHRAETGHSTFVEVAETLFTVGESPPPTDMR